MKKRKMSKKAEKNAPVAAANVAEAPREYEVNCPGCGACLKVKADNMVYQCPVCNKLLRIHEKEKLVKDVSREKMAEAYICVNKGANK